MTPLEWYEIRNHFKEFQKEAYFFNIGEFSYRVSPKSITFQDKSQVFPPWDFDFFEDMWNKMSQEERRRNYLTMVCLYSELLLYPVKESPCKQEIVFFLRRTFTPLLHFAQSISSQMVKHLVTVCRGALSVEVDVFLRIVSREDLGIVLDCFPTHRFEGWGVQNSRALMRFLEPMDTKLYSIRLIQFGYPYLFDYEYFQATVFSIWEHTWIYGVFVKGEKLAEEIGENILNSGNLRMQLALEILHLFFDNRSAGRFKHIMDILWRAVPYPYISSTEMYTLLKPFFKGENISLQEVCDEYKERNFLFEVPEVTEPRTLQHLCRVQIRKSMRDANTISDETIDSLESIPPFLKDYLKLPVMRNLEIYEGRKRKILN